MMNKNADDPAYEQIKQKILDGEYTPAQRLIETNLAQEFGISRHKVRAALDRLHMDGLVHIEPNRGATVMSLELPEVLDILMAREVLEAGVAYLAAGQIEANEIDRLEECLHTMQEALSTGEYEQYSATNKIFHQIIYKASRNETMPQLITVLQQRLIRLQFRTILIPGRTEKSIGEHEAIFLALQAQDAAAADQAARAHMRGLRAAIEKGWQLVRL